MTLEQLGWNDQFGCCFEELKDRSLVPARVAREDREAYVVYSCGRAIRAAVSGVFRHRAVQRADFPAVGDWVAVRPRSGEDRATIVAVLPRRSKVSRKTAGRTADEQVMAANVDSLFICCAVDRDFNARRVERYLSLAYGGGASPLVVLTKADVCDAPPCDSHPCGAVVQSSALPPPANGPGSLVHSSALRASANDTAGVVHGSALPRTIDDYISEIETVAVGAPVVAVSALDGRGIDRLRAYLGVGRTAALVGSSGVGKSSLINRLLEREELRVGAVRESDGRGRHTTTHRQLLLIPGGGIVIDTPGMRELGLTTESADVGSAFVDIEELATGCRFRDCTHAAEPGCRVRAAIDTGEISAQRLESYEKQRRELAYFERRDDPAAMAENKAKWKAIHKSARKWMKDKYRM